MYSESLMIPLFDHFKTVDIDFLISNAVDALQYFLVSQVEGHGFVGADVDRNLEGIGFARLLTPRNPLRNERNPFFIDQ
uniref:Uncharacterized protein n=1 Tax=Romanomermis culicivorax TaxID=13658 RepID=A0A915J6L9_ROMCU